MAERFNAPVLKTGDPQGSVGSNPTPSAKEFAVHSKRFGDSDAMNPSVLIGIVYALWLLLSVYLVVAAIGMKKDTHRHIWQRVGLTLVIVIASAIAAGGGWIFLLVILGSIFLWCVGAEDKLMEQQFPNEYSNYKKRTKALIPFIW
jgi:hypothetical protein